MLIRIGYDIELGVNAPMTLLYLLRVHPSRAADLVSPEAVSISPALAVEDYLDAFGNRCARVRLAVCDRVGAGEAIEQIVDGAILLNQHDDVFDLRTGQGRLRLNVRDGL